MNVIYSPKRIEKFDKFLRASFPGYAVKPNFFFKFLIWLGGYEFVEGGREECFSILYPRFTRSGRSEGEVFTVQNFIRDSPKFIEQNRITIYDTRGTNGAGPFESFREIVHNILRKTILALPGYREFARGNRRYILSVNTDRAVDSLQRRH